MESDNKSRAIVDVDPNDPWYKQLFFNIINGIPVVVWAIFTYFAIVYFSGNPELLHNRDLTLNISVWLSVWGIFTEVAFLTLVSWFFPYFSHKQVKNGSPMEKAACYLFWGFLAIAGAIIISAGIR
jgi:hypothetical protein